ncbi:MAG: hypothetical protein ACRC1T_04970 [Clostridium chrysemydis]|uniref:hypothetical protein n=1 Tax=Clostridium chrysemydis TaxID=2665504 RepID=UPI003F364E96
MKQVYEMLIKNKFYKNREEIIQKLGVASAVNIITDMELAELMQLVNECYPAPVISVSQPVEEAPKEEAKATVEVK